MLESLFDKVTGLHASTMLLKRDSTQVLSCKYCKTFKKTYFKELLQTAVDTPLVSVL